MNLRRNGYDVEVEHDGREGLGRILTYAISFMELRLLWSMKISHGDEIYSKD